MIHNNSCYNAKLEAFLSSNLYRSGLPLTGKHCLSAVALSTCTLNEYEWKWTTSFLHCMLAVCGCVCVFVCMGLLPLERGLQLGQKIWLRLTTASSQCLRISERFFHFVLDRFLSVIWSNLVMCCSANPFAIVNLIVLNHCVTCDIRACSHCRRRNSR